MDFIHGFLLGGIGYGIFVLVLLLVFAFSPNSGAEFVCESHGLELIDYEVENKTFSKVECGNKKPQLQYDGYKVFTK